MTFDEFISKAIDEGIEAAKRDYTKPRQKAKLEGSIEGFEACRGKSPVEIGEILKDAKRKTREARGRVHEKEIKESDYWRIRCREAEIEWIANVVSAALVNQGFSPIVQPTARGAMTAARIVGVKEDA